MNCYICNTPLDKNNETVEHIILNGIGGRLKSKKLICKQCNSTLGSSSDAALSESLAFITDCLHIKKERDNEHKLCMKDEAGDEIIVHNGGKELELKHPSVEKQEVKEGINYEIKARNKEELKKILEGMVKKHEMTAEQVENVLKESNTTIKRPKLSTTISIPDEAFPSIVRSAVNYYIEMGGDRKFIAHLIPYIQGKADCKDVLTLVSSLESPFEEHENEVTHMIHICGSKETHLYAYVEYFSTFYYYILLNSNYDGPDVQETYTFDVLQQREIDRKFNFEITPQWIENYKKNRLEHKDDYFAATKKRVDRVMQKMLVPDYTKNLSNIVKSAFADIPEGEMLTPELSEIVAKKIAEGIIYDIIKLKN